MLLNTWCIGRFNAGTTVNAGDVYLLTGDNLNALLHIVEIQNGLVTFQLRGTTVHLVNFIFLNMNSRSLKANNLLKKADTLP